MPAATKSRPYTPEIGSRLEPGAAGRPAVGTAASGAAHSAGSAPWGVPADFDVPAFLRHAKTYFIRLQAAWDKADINDLREFTTPEMFAELKLQIQERGAVANDHRRVSSMPNCWASRPVGDDYLASVRFNGLISEAADAAGRTVHRSLEPVKPVSGQGGWVLAGIQQIS